MSDAISFGPFVLATPTLLVLVSWALGWWTGSRLNRDDDPGVAKLLTRAFIVTLVAARAAYVVEWSGAYLAHPLDIVDLRDGGWNLPVGLLLGWLYALAARPRQGRSARAVHLALAISMMAFVGGTVALHAMSDDDRRLALRDLRMTHLDGTPTTLQAHEGRMTVVNLWATWCGPCRREMPLLVAAEATHPDIDFVFVNQGEPAEQVTRYLSDQHLSLKHIVLDSASQVARAIDLRGLPTTVYLDAGGRVLAIDVGALSAAKLDQRIASLRYR